MYLGNCVNKGMHKQQIFCIENLNVQLNKITAVKANVVETNNALN